jgi:hypothetical protein
MDNTLKPVSYIEQMYGSLFKYGSILWLEDGNSYLRLRKVSHTIYAANRKVTHIHRRMCERDYTYRIRVGLIKPNRQQSKCYLNLYEVLCIGLIINTRNKKHALLTAVLISCLTEFKVENNPIGGPSMRHYFTRSFSLFNLFCRTKK